MNYLRCCRGDIWMWKLKIKRKNFTKINFAAVQWETVGMAGSCCSTRSWMLAVHLKWRTWYFCRYKQIEREKRDKEMGLFRRLTIHRLHLMFVCVCTHNIWRLIYCTSKCTCFLAIRNFLLSVSTLHCCQLFFVVFFSIFIRLAHSQVVKTCKGMNDRARPITRNEDVDTINSNET